MPISLICGACEATLTAPDAAAGKRVKCRKCGAILEIPLPEPEPDADYEVVEEAPTMMMPSVQSALPRPAVKAPPPPVAKALPLPAKAKPKPVQLEIDEDDEDDRPSPKKPVKKLVAVEDDDEDEDDQPRPKKLKKGKGKKKAAAASNLPLLIGGGVLGLALVGFLVWFLALRTPEVAKGPTPPPGNTQQPGGGPRFPGGPGGTGGQPGAPAGWQEYKKPEFTALFRSGGGEVREQAIPTGPGIRAGKVYANNTVSPGGAQVVTVITLDDLGAAAARQDPKTFLETTLNGTTAGGKGTITARSDSQLNGKPARDATLQTGGKQMFIRAAVDGNRVYMLLAGGDGVNDAQNDQVRVFFDGFKPAGQ